MMFTRMIISLLGSCATEQREAGSDVIHSPMKSADSASCLFKLGDFFFKRDHFRGLL